MVEAVALETVAARWPSFDNLQRFAVIEQLIAAGQFDLADQLLADFVRRSPSPQTRFLLGALRKAQGRLPEAIDVFRELLAENPGFARVRLELAHALYLAEQDESARHHFDLVRGSLANPDLDRVVQGFVDQMDQRRRWNATAYFSIAPSTNLNQGAGVNTISLNGLSFNVDDNARKKSGVGLNTGFNAGYRHPITDRLDIVVAGGGNARQYELDVFNDYVLSGEIGPRYRFSWGDIGLYGTGARRWFSRDAYQQANTAPSGDAFGADPYAIFYGGRFAINARFSPQDISTLSATCLKKQYDTSIWQDGWNCGVNASFDHFLDSKTFLRVLGGVEQEQTKSTHLDYRAGSIGVGAYREFSFGISLYAQAVYTRREFDGIYPTTTFERKDNRLDASLMITKRDWKIFDLAPSLQYTYSLQDSNVDLSTFDAHGVSIMLTKKF